MPQFGTLDVDIPDLPEVLQLADEPWDCEATRTLNLLFEIDDTYDLAMLPPALHPSIPLYCNLMVREHASSPVGPFTLAELRIMGRAGAHHAAFTKGAFASSDEAVDFLRASYGWPVQRAEVKLDKRHYLVKGSVVRDGVTLFEGSLENAEPVTGGDILYPASIHLARVEGELKLVQVEAAYAPDEADRGRPRVEFFNAEAFGDARVKFGNPLPATFSTGRFELQRVRWLMDPRMPAVTGAVRR
jgi:hypothetical protein